MILCRICFLVDSVYQLWVIGPHTCSPGWNINSAAPLDILNHIFDTGNYSKKLKSCLAVILMIAGVWKQLCCPVSTACANSNGTSSAILNIAWFARVHYRYFTSETKWASPEHHFHTIRYLQLLVFSTSIMTKIIVLLGVQETECKLPGQTKLKQTPLS